MTSENQGKRLTVDDIEVPEGMLQAALPYCYNQIHTALQAALLWLAQNPIVPSKEQRKELFELPYDNMTDDYLFVQSCVTEWQRRMVLRKQDALPDEVKKLIGEWRISDNETVDVLARKIYQLGKEGK